MRSTVVPRVPPLGVGRTRRRQVDDVALGRVGVRHGHAPHRPVRLQHVHGAPVGERRYGQARDGTQHLIDVQRRAQRGARVGQELPPLRHDRGVRGGAGMVVDQGVDLLVAIEHALGDLLLRDQPDQQLAVPPCPARSSTVPSARKRTVSPPTRTVSMPGGSGAFRDQSSRSRAVSRSSVDSDASGVPTSASGACCRHSPTRRFAARMVPSPETSSMPSGSESAKERNASGVTDGA